MKHLVWIPSVARMAILLFSAAGALVLASGTFSDAYALPTETEITASDAAKSDLFGSSVSVSGDTAIVGAFQDGNVGSAYIFERDPGSGVWNQVAKLTATDAAAVNQFGRSVAISGDTAIVGAAFTDDAGTNSGSAYIFVKPGGGWVDATETAKLTESNAAAGDEFGESVSISGNTAIVGARFDDDAGTNSGSAFIFEMPVGGWVDSTETIQLSADTAPSDFFGEAVSISEDTAIVGARLEDDGGTNSGSAYIFGRDVGGTGNWGQVAKLTASDSAIADSFGFSVSISGDDAIVGALFHNDAGNDSGSAFLFGRDVGGIDTWGEVVELAASDAAAGHNFGFSVSVSGDTAIVGAICNDDAGDCSGAAYIFVRSGATWTQQDKITASDAAEDDRFGVSASISGDTAMVGANRHDLPGASNAGAAYVLELAIDADDDGFDDTVDCDDTDATVFPGAVEVIGDGIDQDCDGFDLTAADAAEDLISDVEALVDDGILNNGQGNALDKKLDNMIMKLSQGQANAACGQLNAFSNQAADLVSFGILTSNEGQALIDFAEEIQVSLGCS